MSTHRASWDLFAAFLAVHRTGSLSAAARALGLSQPTLRRQIEALEAIVGAPLFLRTATGLAPLEDSQGLVSEAQAMEAAAEAFIRRAGDQRESVSGVIRIAASAVFAVELLPSILLDLKQECPELEIELSVSNEVENILRHDADIAIRLIRPTQDALIARRVAPVVYGFFAAPGAAAEATSALDWLALSQGRFLILQDRQQQISQALKASGLALPRHAAFRSDDDLAQLAAIRAGLGVGITQQSIASKYGLIPVCPEVRLQQDVWIAMHEDQRKLRRVKIVFDFLAEALGTS